jgi:spheroidene monooxygenase
LLSNFVKAAQERSREFWTGMFGVTSSRGQWDQQSWETTAQGDGAQTRAHPQVMGVLTRASIRPSKAMAFWRHAPATQQDLDVAPGCLLAIGLGEAPLLRQCTFSLWDTTESMERYAHHDSHQQAIQASYRHQFFSESLFVRMELLFMQGQWKGKALEHAPQWLGEPVHA